MKIFKRRGIIEEKIKQQAAILDKLIPDLAKVFGMEGFEEVLDIDINFVQVQVLRQIYTLKEPMMSELGRETDIQLSTLTHIVDKLVQKGFVVRKADPSDRRVVRVSVTSQGGDIVRKFEEARRKKIISVLEKLTSNERKKVLQVLQVLHQRISNEVKDED